jgi:hypothetical protein
MPSGKGIRNLDRDLACNPPVGGAGILLGVNIHQQLVRANRIVPCNYNPVGMPGPVWKIDTLDEAYPVSISVDLHEDAYHYGFFGSEIEGHSVSPPSRR